MNGKYQDNKTSAHKTGKPSQPKLNPTPVTKRARGNRQRLQRRAAAYNKLVQRRNAQQLHDAADEGLSGAGSKLPHLDKIQTSFGQHDVTEVSAHVGGKAAEASEAMGAEAYACGEQVAFKSAPDLHTAAHEAAHVIQQRQGLQLTDGIGQEGDAHELHADAVADTVVAGQSAEELLGASKDASSPSSGVQTKSDTNGQKPPADPASMDNVGETTSDPTKSPLGLDEWAANPFPKAKIGATEAVSKVNECTASAGAQSTGGDQPLQLKADPTYPKPPTLEFSHPSVVYVTEQDANLVKTHAQTPEQITSCVLWAQDDSASTHLETLNDLRCQLDNEIEVDGQTCRDAVASDLESAVELDEISHLKMIMYNELLDSIRDIHNEARTLLQQLLIRSKVGITLRLDNLQERSEEDLAAANDAIKQTGDLAKQVLNVGTDVAGAAAKLAAGKDVSAGIDIGKIVVKNLGNVMIDASLEEDYANALGDIKCYYDGLVAQLVPNTKLEDINTFKRKLATVKQEMLVTKNALQQKQATKRAKLPRLASLTNSILASQTNLKSLPLIQNFYVRCSHQGHTLHAHAQTLEQLLAQPDFDVVKSWFDEDRTFVDQAISDLVERGERFAGSSRMPKDHRWMYEPVLLEYWDINNSKPYRPSRRARTEWDRRWEEFREKHPGFKPQNGRNNPKMFSSEYHQMLRQAHQWKTGSQQMSDWAFEMAAWIGEQRVEVEDNLAFTSGPHVEPALSLLNEVTNKLGFGSSGNVVKPAKVVADPQ